MWFYLLLTLYSPLLFILAWKNFRLAIGLFIISLPSYLIRFNIGPYPSTLLELSFGILFLVWLLKHARRDWANIQYLITNNKFFSVSCLLFLISSIASIFVSDMWYYSLGQWRAYILEPMVVFVMLVGRTKTLAPSVSTQADVNDGEDAINRVSTKDLILFLTLSTLSISLVAILQKFTGSLYPPSLWDDQLFGRVTSFFTSPNAVGLYLAPIILLALSVIASRVRLSTLAQGDPEPGRMGRTRRSLSTPAQGYLERSRDGSLSTPAQGYLERSRDGSNPPASPTKPRDHDVARSSLLVMTLAVVSAALAILLARSEGTWAALAAGVVVFAYLIGYKKTAVAAIVAGVLVGMAVPPLREAILFQDQAGKNRLILWKYSTEYLTESPKNFIFGPGIRQFFRKIQKPYYDVKQLERLVYPHNIFLNFWTETGFFGLVGFIGIYYSLLSTSFSLYKHRDTILGAGLIATLVVIFVHGLVDVPYFKNDLAILFWILAAIVLGSEIKNKALV